MDSKAHNVQLKYYGQIVSINMTAEQREEYDSYGIERSKEKTKFIFDSFPPLPTSTCKQLVNNGQFTTGNWLSTYIRRQCLGEMSVIKMVVREFFEVSYKETLVSELWCSIRDVSISRMSTMLELPWFICEIIYDYHEENYVATDVQVTLEDGVYTIKR